jgi:hypothetical protein
LGSNLSEKELNPGTGDRRHRFSRHAETTRHLSIELNAEGTDYKVLPGAVGSSSRLARAEAGFGERPAKANP